MEQGEDYVQPFGPQLSADSEPPSLGVMLSSVQEETINEIAREKINVVMSFFMFF